MRIVVVGHRPEAAYDIGRRGLIGILERYASPGTHIDVAFPDDYPGAQVERQLATRDGLNGLDHAIATAAIVRTVVRAEADGYDAVVANNTFDPAIDAARLAVRIPVIGPLRASLHAATTLSDNVGILVPLASHVPYTWRLLRTMGMASFVTDVQVMGGYGPNLPERREELVEAAVAAIDHLVRTTGAQAVIPLGGALIPDVVDPTELGSRTGVPVYNTKAIAIQFAEVCVRLQLTHSPRTYPPAGLAPDTFGQLLDDA